MLYAGLKALGQQYGLHYLCLVPSTLYGPGYHTDGRQMHFIFDLIRKILRARRGGPAAVLWGDGHQRRELVYVLDFVKAAVHLAGAAQDTLINIGAGEEFSIREFAAIICELTGYEFAQIQFDTARYVGARSKCLAVAKMRWHLPGFELTPLRAGLARTLEWFEDNPHLVDESRSAVAA
jgi:GDP-L-fucose synthase